MKLLSKLVIISYIPIAGYLCLSLIEYVLLKTQDTTFSNVDYAIDGQNQYYQPDTKLIFRYTNYPHPQQSDVIFIGDQVVSTGQKYIDGFSNLYGSSHSSQLTSANFGTQGYNLDQQYLLADELAGNRPKLLIWNISVSNIWESIPNCLFTDKSGSFIQIPATKNTLYWQGLVSHLLPNRFVKSHLNNFIWTKVNQTLNPKNNLYGHTTSCTPTKINNESIQNVFDRLNYFVRTLNQKLLQQNGQLIVVINPFQQYFQLANSTDFPDPSYLKLTKSIASDTVKYVDMNTEIYQQFPAYKNPGDTLFLSQTEDDFPSGWRHPNETMYHLMAQVLSAHLSQNQ